MSELRECPFCGGTDTTKRLKRARWSRRICNGCKAAGPLAMYEDPDPLWNTRPASRVETAARRYVLAMEAHHAVSEKPATRARERTAHQLWKEAQEEYANLRAALAQEGEEK